MARRSSLMTSGRLLDNIPSFQLEFGEKSEPLLLTRPENMLGFTEKNLITSGDARMH
jgi:hypothetical protein